MKGFTLIELIIVIAISAMLSALVITFSNVGKNQVTLSVETAKLTQFILRAKDLAIATYNLDSPACGYGVEFNIDQGTYSLFAYATTSTPCPAASAITSTSIPSSTRTQQVTQSTWNVPLARGIVMRPADDNLIWVLFYPPAPAVFISRTSSAAFINQPSSIHLATADGSASATITVNPAGQVSF